MAIKITLHNNLVLSYQLGELHLLLLLPSAALNCFSLDVFPSHPKKEYIPGYCYLFLKKEFIQSAARQK